MRQKQNERRQSQRQGEERDRGATNDWLIANGEKKRKNEINSRKPQRRRDERKKKKKSARERVVGCQTGVEAPRPSLPFCPSPKPNPPPPHLPGRGGVDMGARWGGDEKKHSTHGWRLSY